MIRQLKTAALVYAVLTVVTGVVYPCAVTLIAQIAMPEPANGSFIRRDGAVVGSALIGQSFSSAKYFWGRPSATDPMPYNAGSSSGSNRAIGNPAQLDAMKFRIDKLRAADPDNLAAVPIDLVTASGSGLDPHISSSAAEYQVGRVARARGMAVERVRALVLEATEPPQFGILGEPRVNVLQLNLRLDDAAAAVGDNDIRTR